MMYESLRIYLITSRFRTREPNLTDDETKLFPNYLKTVQNYRRTTENKSNQLGADHGTIQAI
jgi:hypothetical protein